MARALKVFRTPIGFHDAYVAAPSRKAALEAWGAAKDLFASGSAELVTDTELIKAPLASPGEVIKVSRGDAADHLRAAGKGKSGGQGKTARPSSQRASAPKPRPSRKALDLAEAAVTEFEKTAAAERSILDKREAELLRERKALNAWQRRDADKLEARLGRAPDTNDRAMERWRGS
jgi:hypothetical protein